MKNRIFLFIRLLFGLFFVIYLALYFYQEKLIFFPEKLDKNYCFDFETNFEEIDIKTTEDNSINGLLFKSKNTKGLIFYLHGNAGALNTWGNLANTYTDLNYDLFILDYRGYGEGEITSQNQLFEDNQIAYEYLKKFYNENDIIIIGYSIGTGLASKLASENNPKQLILQAPYYNFTDLIQHKFSIIPPFIVKYKFSTNEYLKNCKASITIFHGKNDNLIYYESSVKLKADFKNQVELIGLENQGHNGITYNPVYRKIIKELLK